MNEKLEKIKQILQDAERTHLWGVVEFTFNDGELSVIRETKTTKLLTRRGNTRDAQANL